MGQLELQLWPEWTLRGCLTDYLTAIAGRITAATMTDYQDRAAWLCGVLGEGTRINGLPFKRMERLVKDWGPDGKGLLLVTIRRRLRTLRAALLYAADRDLLTHMQVFRMPPQLFDDGRRREAFHTVEQFTRFREFLHERAQRTADLLFWTGHHISDVRRMRRWMLDPDFVWKDDQGRELARGRYWRVNTKNRRCQPAWFPMEPELRALAIGWLAQHHGWKHDSTVAGRVWSLHRAFAAAADRAQLPRVAPIDLRRSYASMLASRFPEVPDYIRMALGHECPAVVTPGEALVRTAKRPTTATAHYLRPTGDMLRATVKRRRR